MTLQLDRSRPIPDTRDIVQNVYIRKVERVDGILQNVEFDQIPDVKDPGKK